MEHEISVCGILFRSRVGASAAGSVFTAELTCGELPVTVRAAGYGREEAEEKAVQRLQAALLGNYWYNGEYDGAFYSINNFQQEPYEYPCSVNELLEQRYRWCRILYQTLMKNSSRYYSYEDYLYLFRDRPDSEGGKSLTLLPFCRPGDRGVEGVPEGALDYFGKCHLTAAGANRSEALVRVLSGLIKIRHSIEIYKKCIRLPEFPDEAVFQFAEIREIVENLRSLPGRLVLLDASLETGFPVVAALLLHKSRGRYRISYGAAPCLKDALKDALCSLLECDDYASGAVTDREMLYKPDVLYHLLNGRMVCYHYEFFQDPFEGSAADARFCAECTAEEGLEKAAAYFQDRDYSVYVRDISVKDPACVQVFVPEMYEYLMDFGLWVGEKNMRQKCLAKGGAALYTDGGRLERLAVYMAYKQNFCPDSWMSRIFLRPVVRSYQKERYISVRMVICLCLGKYAEARELAAGLIKEMQERTEGKRQEYLAVWQYAALKAGWVDEEKIWKYIAVFTSHETADEIKKVMSDPAEIVKRFGFWCNDFQCGSCVYRSICCYEKVRALSERLYRRKKLTGRGKQPEIAPPGEVISPGALTSREQEVAELYTGGATRKEIAGELFISEQTVKKHMQNIFFKLNVSNKAQLINLWKERKESDCGKKEKYF